ncbi:MAG: 50S ribosomal protein L25/general stress protein Ctc [Desulforegulaceae bacterium]|nr:50S ribosomal protein L25/general stress protein Ctc [Desulforegulaceae bacterium]
MKFIEIEALERKETGKQAGKALRRDKRIPAVIYGRKTEALPVSVNTIDLEKAIKKTDTMEVFLKVALGSNTYQAMIKELQADVVSGKFLHADFLTIEKDQVLDFRVPVEVFGEEECPGIENGGMLQILRREIDVRCTADNIPESVKIDVSELELGDAVHIEEIEFGPEVEVDKEVNYTVLTIVAPDAEEPEEEELDEDLEGLEDGEETEESAEEETEATED